MYKDILTLYRDALIFFGNHPYLLCVALLAAVFLIAKISRAGLLKQCQIQIPFLGANLSIRWTGPTKHDDDPDLIQTKHHIEVFTKSLLAARYNTPEFNFKAFAEMMAINGYGNISIEPIENEKEKEKEPPTS